MKNLFKITLIALLFLPFSCSDDEGTTEIESPKSDAKSIISFSFESAENSELENDVQAIVSESENTITAELPNGIDISTLVPTIEISELSTVSPSGAQDFNSSITYKVTAEDESIMEYVASVNFKAITLNAMNPESGPKNTVVTFTGTNFGTDTNMVKVFFDDIEAEVQQVSQTSIVAVVPPKAFTGVVRILIGEQELNGLVFDYQISDVQVSILAGVTQGFVDGNAAIAQFSFPDDITIDQNGDLFITEGFNNSVRKITFEFEGDLLADIVISTLAGNGSSGFLDGNGQNAQFDAPTGITIDNDGNLYISDTFNHTIRRITSSGEVSTLLAVDPVFDPRGITIDSEGNIYVIDGSNHRISKVILPNEINTFVGDGISGFINGDITNARFSFPKDITIDSEGNFYVTDSNNNSVRKITPSGTVTTLAGDGTSGFEDGIGSEAKFNFPQGITIDIEDNLYVVDVGNHSIRKITSSGMVSTIAGNGTSGFNSGVGSEAQFNQPRGITIDSDGNLFVVDRGNHSIRKITQD